MGVKNPNQAIHLSLWEQRQKNAEAGKKAESKKLEETPVKAKETPAKETKAASKKAKLNSSY